MLTVLLRTYAMTIPKIYEVREFISKKRTVYRVQGNLISRMIIPEESICSQLSEVGLYILAKYNYWCVRGKNLQSNDQMPLNVAASTSSQFERSLCLDRTYDRRISCFPDDSDAVFLLHLRTRYQQDLRQLA
jgi:hypothetical protein